MPAIFSIDQTNSLSELSFNAYEREVQLQELIAKFPRLLVGDLGTIEDVPRWMLVKREFKVPGVLEWNSRFSLDALYLDQDGVPVLVEVKRSENTQIKREVVGQLLDYARGFLASVNAQLLRRLFEERCGGAEKSQEELRELLLDSDADGFWETVSANLANRKLQLVIVSDSIPMELRQLLEFLDEQMPTIDVFAIAIKQYSSADSQVRFMLSEAVRVRDSAYKPSLPSVSEEGAVGKTSDWSEIVTFNRDPAIQAILREEASKHSGSPSVRKIYYNVDGVMRWRIKVQKSSVNIYQQMRFRGDYVEWKNQFPDIKITTPDEGGQLSFSLTRPEDLLKFVRFAEAAEAKSLPWLPRGVKGERAV
jgi:hypothetical protein